MAGTLTISTLSDGTNSTSSTNCIQGSAKAWCNYNGVAGSITKAYNVSSVTKNGTGDYTYNFTNALPDANYCVTAALNNDIGNINITIKSVSAGSAPTLKTTTQLRMAIAVYSGAYYDATTACIAVFD